MSVARIDEESREKDGIQLLYRAVLSDVDLTFQIINAFATLAACLTSSELLEGHFGKGCNSLLVDDLSTCFHPVILSPFSMVGQECIAICDSGGQNFPFGYRDFNSRGKGLDAGLILLQ